jgi:hypothetical protein
MRNVVHRTNAEIDNLRVVNSTLVNNMSSLTLQAKEREVRENQMIQEFNVLKDTLMQQSRLIGNLQNPVKFNICDDSSNEDRSSAIAKVAGVTPVDRNATCGSGDNPPDMEMNLSLDYLLLRRRSKLRL